MARHPATRALALAPALALLMLVAHAPAALAQSGRELIRVAVTGGAQVYPDAIAQRFTRPLNVETAEYTADLSTPLSGFIEAGARVRVLRNLAAGLSVSYASAQTGGTVNASLPHPFYFRQPRAISGDVDDLERRELAVHAEAAWTFRVTPRLQVTVFGGPSYIQVRHALVTDVSYAESFPFDTATFARAVTASATVSALGFNGGGDVSWRVGRQFGVAGLVRYARADVTLTPAAGNNVAVRAGGVQAGGGLRFYF